MWTALGRLPPKQRAAVVQRYYLGMSEEEMSRRAVTTPGTIKSRLHAARKSLSGILRPRSRTEPAPAVTGAEHNFLGRGDDVD